MFQIIMLHIAGPIVLGIGFAFVLQAAKTEHQKVLAHLVLVFLLLVLLT